MVFDYYHLREQPFGVTPDPGYLYLGATHREALASLLYGVEAGCGFVVLIAKPGLGKTTLLRHTLNQLRDKARTVFLFQTIGTPADLLRALLNDLGVHETPASLIEMQSRLNEILVEQSHSGKRLVVVIDEAQNLDDSVLELLRMLSNFETSRDKLIQVVLSGQPELAEKIGSPQLVQLRQRVSIFARLNPFSAEETSFYIEHRMRIAGYSSETPLFTKPALGLIAQYSEGIPRNINNICFNALSVGFALKQKTIDCDIIREVIADLDIDPWRKKGALAVLGDHHSTRGADKHIAGIRTSSTLPAWLPRLGVAAAVSFLLCGALIASLRWPAASVFGQADRVALPLAPAAPVPINAERVLSQPASASEIQVTPGQTVSGICVEHFGSCTPELLQRIQGLNPELSSLDIIKPGQPIRIPVSGAIVNAAEQHDKSSLAQRSIQ